MLLQGKTAIVTGGSRGIGAAIAALFLQEGARVFITSRNERTLEMALDAAAGIEGFVCDFEDPASIHEFGKAVHAAGLLPDILVNNAGIMEDALLMMSKDEMVRKQIAVNLTAPILISREMVKIMARKKAGSIINIASIIGVHGNAGQSVYSATKAGVIGFTKSLAKELAPLHIRVNGIAPGFIDTDLVASYTPELRQKTLDRIGMKKPGSPADIAQTALYLASENSTYVTGQIIGIDGGMVI